MAIAPPVRLANPWIRLGTTATPTTDMKCFARGIHLTPEADDSLATFCDPTGYAWTLTIDFLMSLGATESFEAAMTTLGGAGTVVFFEFAYSDVAASAANPHWKGQVRLVPAPIVDAGINEPTEFSLEMPVIGVITRTIV